jgi:hypothetical protein
LGSALRAVESGDRTAPSQAIAVYAESGQAAKAREEEWARLKAERLPELNQQLRQAKVGAIKIAEIEREVEWLMSR